MSGRAGGLGNLLPIRGRLANECHAEYARDNCEHKGGGAVAVFVHLVIRML
jgi:hypothetical protein